MPILHGRALRRIVASAVTSACVAGALTSPLHAQDTRIRGTLHVVWDVEPEWPAGEAVAYFIVADSGAATRVELAGAGVTNPWRLAGSRVEAVLRERAAGAGPAAAASLRVLAPSSFQSQQAEATTHAAPRAFLTLFCRFADEAEPFQPSALSHTLGTVYPGMQQYYGELADDASLMSGNAVAGWFSLPQPRSHYVQGTNTRHFDLFRDCTQAADPHVDFAPYYGLNLQFSGALGVRAAAPYDTLSFGGSATLAFDGPSRSVGVTWMSRNHWQNFVVWAHEMGHALGWPHSSGRYGSEYDSRWDVMSVGYLRHEPPFGWLTIHTIAPHKISAGFVPSSRIWRPAQGSNEAHEIVRSALPPATGYVAAEIPIGAGRVYTVEVRLHAGHDTPLPGEVVLIHEVVSGRAFVVDPDGNGDPNDEGAMWRVGESFDDVQNEITVAVEARTENGYLVRIRRGPAAAVVAITTPPGRPGALMGAAYADTIRASGGGGAQQWVLVAGALPAGLALDAAAGTITGVPEVAGSFAWTLRVEAGGTSAEQAFTLHVAKPVLAASSVLDHLLGTPSLTTDQARFLDLLGNRNGRLDIGDVRAWLVDTGALAGAPPTQPSAILEALRSGAGRGPEARP